MTFALAGVGAGTIGTQRAAAPHRPADLESGAHSIGADLFAAELDTAVATTGMSDGPRRAASAAAPRAEMYEEKPPAREAEHDATTDGAVASSPARQDVDAAPTASLPLPNRQENPESADDPALAAAMLEETGGGGTTIGDVEMAAETDLTTASQPTDLRGQTTRAAARSGAKGDDVTSDAAAEAGLEDAIASASPEPEGTGTSTGPEGAAAGNQPAIPAHSTYTGTPTARTAQDASISDREHTVAADTAIDEPQLGAGGDPESHTDAQSSAQQHAEPDVEPAGPERAATDAAAETRTTVQQASGFTRAVAERLEAEQAATADSPAHTLAPDTTDRLVKSMRLQYLRGGGDALVQLRPEHFGPVTISLRVEDGTVSARIAADNAMVAEWLQANEATLREALKANGLYLDRLIVDRDGQSPHHHAQREQTPRRHARPRLTERESTFEVSA